jgi:hypothetical protein
MLNKERIISWHGRDFCNGCLGQRGCSVEAQYLKIYRLEKGIEHFSLNITHHIQHFHQYIFAIGFSIFEIQHPKSHDRLSAKVPG